VRHVDYSTAWGSSAAIETYGDPRVHVFEPNQDAPFLHLELINTSRWTITVNRIDPPPQAIDWEVRLKVTRRDADLKNSDPFHPVALRPDEA
jgi:hypothetical protein